LAVLIVALLPGALYVWSFERQVGRWGVGLSDRLLRFVGGSAIFHAAFAPASYWCWSTEWQTVRAGSATSWWLWPFAVAYVLVPIAGGATVGRATRSSSPWARWFTGPDPAPRAWDHLFQPGSFGWVRIRLRSGTWLGGAFADSPGGRRSYAAGYPESQDLYLATTISTDPSTGEFEYDECGGFRFLDGGLLIRWDEVEYLQFTDS
jgi:hypothetical protein